MDPLFHLQESKFWHLVILPTQTMGSYIFTKQLSAFHTWTDLFEVIKLEKNEQKISDVQYAELLERIRIGHQTCRAVKLLNSISNLHLYDPEFHEALRIFPTKSACNEYNSEKLQRPLQHTVHNSILKSRRHFPQRAQNSAI